MEYEAMSDQRRFKINGPKVIHHAFETEVVIVNLDSGIYYSLTGSGATLWRSLAAGANLASIIASHGSENRDAILGLVDELIADQLISGDGSGSGTHLPRVPESFSKPVLQKYTDMQDMLLLDPIHEVDDAGWPVEDRGEASRTA